MDRNATLRMRREEADKYSVAHGLDYWGFRIAWFVTSEGVEFTRAVCSKYNKTSPAWKAYQLLVDAEIIVEGPEGGIVYNACPEWEDGEGPLRWIEALAKVAAGGERHPLL